MALYHKWDVKNDFAYVLQFLSLISYSLGGVRCLDTEVPNNRATHFIIFEKTFPPKQEGPFLYYVRVKGWVGGMTRYFFRQKM